MDGFTVRGVHIPDGELQWRFTGSGGPGGQHANTANTAVELRFDLDDSQALPERLKERIRRRLATRLTSGNTLIVQASEHRSQTRNREEALRRMAALLEEATAPPPKPRRPTKPSAGARQRRLDAKRQRAEVKRSRRPPQW